MKRVTIRQFIDLNKFFVRESYSYAGGFWPQPWNWTKAYFRFMYFSLTDPYPIDP
jgi:hypothetical protein